MSPRETDKRSRLVEAAVGLVHRQGFQQTTLAQIAEEAGVPLGNVYYYFKTKEAIGEELVGQYVSFQTACLQAGDAGPDPVSRLETFIDLTFSDPDAVARHGCPIGSLNSELHKRGGPLAERAAVLFADALAWLEAQFRALGRGEKAPDLAAHLLASLQGAALLAHTFGDPGFVARESRHLKEWLRTL